MRIPTPQTKKPNYIIGIDPDVDKNGVALLEVSTKRLFVRTMSFAETIDFMEMEATKAKIKQQRLLVVIEAGWLNKGHWHINNHRSRAHAAAIGNSTGRNHETGIHLAEMCQHKGIEITLRRPLRKCWRGADGKITAAELNKLTNQTIQTNQEGRDAALLAWVEAY